ncbi:hypothetical protein [Caminibacter sp.]
MKKLARFLPLGLVLAGSSAFAAIDTTNVNYDTTDVTTVAGLVLGAVAVIWGLRKAISIANRG